MAELRVSEDEAREAAARLRELAAQDLVADPGGAVEGSAHARLIAAASQVGSEQARASRAISAEALSLAASLDQAVELLTAADRRLARTARPKATPDA